MRPDDLFAYLSLNCFSTLKWLEFVMLFCHNSAQKSHFFRNLTSACLMGGWTDGRTNRPTDEPTDTPFYSDARRHKKKSGKRHFSFIFRIIWNCFKSPLITKTKGSRGSDQLPLKNTSITSSVFWAAAPKGTERALEGHLKGTGPKGHCKRTELDLCSQLIWNNSFILDLPF